MPKTLVERFWSKVDKTGDCWFWQACKNQDGYGQISHHGKMLSAHRISWGIVNGPIPDGLNVLHNCDNPPCVNPAHLFLGTNIDNIQDSINKGRHVVPYNMGEAHPQAILKLDQVREIKKSTLSQRKLARQYDVSPGTIQCIKDGRNWRYVNVSDS